MCVYVCVFKFESPLHGRQCVRYRVVLEAIHKVGITILIDKHAYTQLKMYFFKFAAWQQASLLIKPSYWPINLFLTHFATVQYSSIENSIFTDYTVAFQVQEEYLLMFNIRYQNDYGYQQQTKYLNIGSRDMSEYLYTKEWCFLRCKYAYYLINHSTLSTY